MGFYLRKSIKVGPLRFNLSKSGIGVSAGVKGFRVGMGPRGNYIHMGRGGIYYRQTIPAASPLRPSQVTVCDRVPAGTHAPLESIKSVNIDCMIDSSSQSLLTELTRKRRRPRLWPLVLCTGVVAIGLSVFIQAHAWLAIFVGIVFGILTATAYLYDVLKKSVVIMYDLDEQTQRAFRELVQSFGGLRRSRAIWHVSAQGRVYEKKYHAGADSLINRKRIDVRETSPPFVRTNVPTPHVQCGPHSLFFMPDRVLIFSPRMVGAVPYAELEIALNETQMIERGRVPSDAIVVDRTWRYVNKNGSPDRRFKNNYEIPVCLYEEIYFASPKGLGELIQNSRRNSGEAISRAVEAMAKHLDAIEEQQENPAVGVAARAHGSETNGAIDFQATQNSLCAVIVDTLCCVMSADGRASRSEQQLIIDGVLRLGFDWDGQQVKQRVKDRLEKIHEIGFTAVVETTLEQLALHRELGWGSTIIELAKTVASADGVVAQREQAICNRIRKALSIP